MQQPDATIREFRIDDYDAAVALWRQVEGVEIAEGDSREQIASYLARNPGLSFVAETNGAIVGAVLCGHDGRRGYIYHLAVHPTCRGKGIARSLVDKCIIALGGEGIERALILVAGDNTTGKLFWSRAGWEELEGVVPFARDVPAKKNDARSAHSRHR